MRPGPAYPNPAPPADPRPVSAASANPIGLASFIVAIGLVVVSLASIVLAYALPVALGGTTDGYQTLAAILGAFNVATGVIAVVALVLGIIGLTRPHARRAMAAAGAAVGAYALAESIVIGASTALQAIPY